MNDRTIAARLGALKTNAPADLHRRVLEETGLVDRYTRLDGPIGPVLVAFSSRGVTACRLGDDGRDFEDWYEAALGRPVTPAPELPARLASRIRTALASGKANRVPFDLAGLGGFAAAVLTKAAEIPPGEVRPYSWIAREIGRPAAVRAVGTALANNPIPVLIPCHRVVRSDGTIGNYAFGPAAKRALLAAEGLEPAVVDDLARRRVRYVGSDTTGVFCHPTCHAARRITDRHRHEFASQEEAREAGYRPCRLCRPVAA